MEMYQTSLHEIHKAGGKILKSLDKFCTDKKVNHYKIFFSDTKCNTDFNTLTGIIYVFKYNHLMSHDSKVIYTDALLKFMIATGVDALFAEHPKTHKVSCIEIDPIDDVSAMTIATCRVKVIPDHIIVKADEKDLHLWSPSKIFSDGSREKTNRRGIITKIDLNDMNYDIDAKCYDKLDTTDIKDALIRHQPVFNDNYLLDVILYHDYLKNVVIGQMRRSMNEIINQICRDNLRKMGDVDGDF